MGRANSWPILNDAVTFRENDVVRVLRPLPEHKVPRGALGAVIMVFDDPPAYEVEFCDDYGVTVAFVRLTPRDLEKISG